MDYRRKEAPEEVIEQLDDLEDYNPNIYIEAFDRLSQDVALWKLSCLEKE